MVRTQFDMTVYAYLLPETALDKQNNRTATSQRRFSVKKTVVFTEIESEFNLSYNPTLVTGSYASGSLVGFATSESFQPYATAIGLYNTNNELLMVAKLGKPIMISPDTDMTFIVRYDT